MQPTNRSFIQLICPLLAILALLAGCVPTKRLPKGDYLLYDQGIEGTQQVSVEDLEAFYRHKPNRKILYMPLMPYLSAYYLGKKSYDRNISQDSAKAMQRYGEYLGMVDDWETKLKEMRKLEQSDTAHVKAQMKHWLTKAEAVEEKLQRKIKEGNWMMRSVGEPPAIFRQLAMKQTAEQMEKFLHTKGFFQGKVQAKADTVAKRAKVTYTVYEGPLSKLDTISYIIPDTAVRELILKDSINARIKTGQRFDEGAFEQERLRILKLMKNNGYYDFSKAYIYFEVDTTVGNQRVRVRTFVKNTSKGPHKAYRIDQVLFDTNADAMRQRVNSDTLVYDGIEYIQERKIYSKRVLNRKVFIRPGLLYSQTDAEDTQRALADLNIFKFVNIKYDSTGGKFKANIFVSPYPKYQVGIEGGLNVNQSFIPGPFMTLSFTNRNLLNSADIFEVQSRFSVEAQASATNTDANLRSIQASTNALLTLPRIFFPIPEKWKRVLSARSPKTQFSIGYAFIDRPEYIRTNLQGAIAYQWVNKKKANFSFSLLDVGIINTASIDSLFKNRLLELQAQGNTLINSFDRSLVSSTLFSYTTVSSQYGTRTETTQYFRGSIENGGPSVHAINKYLLGNEEAFLGLRYYRFFKMAIDYRVSVPIAQHGQLATRVHAGLADPYGTKNRVLPYEKYFFSGGSSSNRAWRARRVGPGSFSPEKNADGTFNYQFEQYGEVLVELNAELRSKLFGFVDGALFVDATNIWMLRDDTNRPGALFQVKDFWKEFAIGSGVGIRFDFSFLLIRFDVGVKMYDPARPVGDRFVMDQISFRRPLGAKDQHIFNVGIGYPF